MSNNERVNIMCNNKNNQTDGNCIAEILRIILILQQNACPDNCLDSCDRPMLGGGSNCLICNTRPIMLYTCCGHEPLSMPVCKDATLNCSTDIGCPDECSTVFRVEKIEGNCCTCRVLAPNREVEACTCVLPYLATNSFFTINLDCVCVIRCLSDVYVECV